MESPKIETTYAVVPMCYAYSTPGVEYHEGWTKIGYTEIDVAKRIYQQTHTAGIRPKEEWRGEAVFQDGSNVAFKDKDFHVYLRKNNIEQEEEFDNEWFKINGPESKDMYDEFRGNHGIVDKLDAVVEYRLRKEQEEAVKATLNYMKSHKGGEFLWNCKPRFGKTLSVYDLIQKMEKVKTILIVTNRPAVASSWFSDYQKFMGIESGFRFVSEVDVLKNTNGVLSCKEYGYAIMNSDSKFRLQFVSLQDLKGSIYFGGQHDKLKEVADLYWDLLVIDEAHEAVDTFKTDVAFDRINRGFTLHLSGTPFKAMAMEKFNEDAIFSWTYADEQKAKAAWDDNSEFENPYADLPQINLFTYKMSDIVKEDIKQGVDIEGENVEFAFDLNEFFSTNASGNFIYDSSVDKFLNALTSQKKFPFSSKKLRDELKHTFWLLQRVDSCKALARKLKVHPVFKDYHVVLAAGDGRLEKEEEIENSYKKVKDAIKNYDKTITLSVEQLTTGVTVPEWSAVMMLSNCNSSTKYIQAAFRAQNPCLVYENKHFERKQNCYIFDFDPARTLIIYEEFANDLSKETAAGKGDSGERKKNIRELLNFFPVIGEDENGELIQLDEERVLTIPRKLKSTEVVNRGFMSNYLFQNISNVFSAPKIVEDILSNFEPVSEPKGKQFKIKEDGVQEIEVDENGEVVVNELKVNEAAEELFGKKIYDTSSNVDYAVNKLDKNKGTKKTASEELKEAISEDAVKDIIEKVKDNYSKDLKVTDIKKLQKKITNETNKVVDKSFSDYDIDRKLLIKDREIKLKKAKEYGKSKKEINLEFDKKEKILSDEFKEKLTNAVNDTLNNSKLTAVETAEKTVSENLRQTKEEQVRDHLRGFSRTIPSFLMAYGDKNVRLENFDKIVPADVFKEVTSVSIEEFKFLRDGGDYVDEETGKTKHYDGELFDPIVFNDSVVEFMNLKDKLKNYFDESAIEDIFDYVPPQKTNQIFTPKRIVRQMVDMLEKENPGCYDDPDKTFADLYMKSGLYIAEIVKRLFNSKSIKKKFPDERKRLEHIFKNQVYGLAPTEIIYKISTNYILGFNDKNKNIKHNFKLLDALPYAKEGTLDKKLDEIYKKK